MGESTRRQCESGLGNGGVEMASIKEIMLIQRGLCFGWL